VLPLHDKEEIVERFTELKSWLLNNYTDSDIFWNQNAYGWKRWEAVIKFMNEKDDSDQLTSFNEYITKLDRIRNTDFKNTFPELSHLIS
jgi:hypothetical protein